VRLYLHFIQKIKIKFTQFLFFFLFLFLFFLLSPSEGEVGELEALLPLGAADGVFASCFLLDYGALWGMLCFSWVF